MTVNPLPRTIEPAAMLQTNRFALKEWAVVIEGLKAGQQLILLRKGGVQDQDGEFHVERPEFFLYPAFEHQQRQYVRQEFLADFDRSIAAQPRDGDLVISAYAQVTDCFVAKNFDLLRRLAPYHLWNEEFIQMRFNYKSQSPLYVLLLRAFETASSQLPVRPEYGGCRSWVELDRELSTSSARPVLGEHEFENLRREIRTLLEV